MVDRIGDWYAFSSACFCRATTVYESMHWASGFDPRSNGSAAERSQSPPSLAFQASFSFQAYCGGAAAPFGGFVALIRAADTDSALTAVAQSAVEGPCSSCSYAIDVFTSAGAYRTTFGVPASDGEVCGMEWTTEGVELCVLTATQSCLFFDVASTSPAADSGRGLLGPPSSWQPCARKMNLRVDGVASHAPTAAATPTRSASVSPMICFAVTPFSVACVGADQRVRALVHAEQGRSRLLPEVALASAAPGSSTRMFHTTAVALLPDTVSESGESVVYWARSAVYRDARVVTADDDHQLCAIVLDADRVEDPSGEERDTSSEGGAALATLRVRGRVHHLQLCPHHPTRLLLFTARGTLHIVASDLQHELFSLDFAFAAAAELFPRLPSLYDGPGMDNASLSAAPPGLSFINASLVAADVSDGTGDRAAGTSAPADWEASVQGCHGVGALASSATSVGLAHGTDTATASFLPTAITWCGPHFALLHYGSWRTPVDTDDGEASPCFSLLICLHRSATVHGARLDWSLEGLSGRVLCSSEVDGARVVSEGRCLMLHEVPRALVDLCRLAPPYSAAARVVRAFEAYMDGGYHGLAQVRSALLEPDDGQPDEDAPSPEAVVSRVSKTFFDLVDAATWEWDAERQKRLLAAASFANTMCQLPHGSEVLVDVMKRLRVLRAVRLEAQCHVPLTPAQYRVLNGDWSARLPSAFAHRDPATSDDADDAVQLSRGSDDEGDEDGAASDTTQDLEEAVAQRLVGKNEAAVLVDRLAALGHFRLALEVATTLGAKAGRVVTYWAQQQVRQADASTPTDVVAARVTQVLSCVPETSYVEAASEALACGRVDLAQRLLQAETRSDKKVELLLRHRVFSAAAQCAADGGDANLLFLAVDALATQTAGGRPAAVVDSTTTTSATPSAGRLSPADLQEVLVLLQSSPTAARYLVHGAGFLSSWQSLFTALATAGVLPSDAAAYRLLEDSLWGHNARQRSRLAQDVAQFLKPLDPLRLTDPALEDGEEDDGSEPGEGKKRKKKKSKKQGTSAAVGDDAAPSTEEDGAGVYALPPVAHTKPSAPDACSDIAPSELETIMEALDTSAPRRTRATSSTAGLDAAWLAQQRDLETMKEQLAERYRDSRFFHTASVVDVLGLLYEHNAAEYAERMAKVFKVPTRMRLFACFEVLCASNQWDRVDDFLGTPPPLRKSGFFSRSGRSSGSDGAADTLGYLAVVEVLLRYGQEERAAQFIPGVTEDAVERVQWYMSLRAPVMAMEAAYVSKDSGLIEQVLAKVPSTHTRVIERGQELLRQLQQES